MRFDSPEFAAFLALLLGLHWLLPRRAALQNAVVLAASWIFFFTWSPRLLGLLVLSTVVHYALGVALGREEPDASPRRRALLGLGVAYGAGQLFVFKYAGFFATSLNALLGDADLPWRLPVLQLATMIGISFWTLQNLGYLIDVYYRRIPACRSPLAFAVFSSFFPQLLSGPIARGRQLLPQLEAPRALRPEALQTGASIFLLGFFKKFFVADLLGKAVVDPVFSDPAGFAAAAHWLALAGFAVQVYCDFSGYSEMALGLGRFLGIELPLNFDHPFLSRNVMELWRRWHITLNTWLFDYLYGPLTTGRGFFRGRLDLGFLIVFGVSGLWHGATVGFLLWGALQGVALVAHRRFDVFYRGLCRTDRRWVARRRTRSYQLAAWALTLLVFVLTLVPFRAPTLAASATFWAGLFGGGGSAALDLSILDSAKLALAFGSVAAFEVLALPQAASLSGLFFRVPAPLRGVVYGLIVVFLLLFMPVGSGTFLYAAF